MKTFTASLLSLLLAVPVFASELSSPDGKITLSFELEKQGAEEGCPVYGVRFGETQIIKKARLGLDTGAGNWTHGLKFLTEKKSSHDEIWKPVYGERSSVRDHYNQLDVALQSSNPECKLIIEFRCYNEGIALRYRILSKSGKKDIQIKSEMTEFAFLGDHRVWTTTQAQGGYSQTKISGVRGNHERPLVMQINEGLYAAVAEAAMVDYGRMLLVKGKNPHCLVSAITGQVKLKTPCHTPWRVVMLGKSPGQLIENNHIILNLNEPCAIKDTSWIRPGKVIREISLTTKGAKRLVDFAVRRKIEFIEFDAGWYGYEYDNKSDATTVTVDPKRSPGPLDLLGVIKYAKKKNIGVILYVNDRALKKQIDDILPLFQKWGVAGVKYGFVAVGSHSATQRLHENIRKAAKYKLMVDVHDNYRPTGYSRTYPNLMTMEGIRGDEVKQNPASTLNTIFTRMVAGAGDNTICYFSPRVSQYSSHANQLAKAVCIYSPWQFIYWYDTPAIPGQTSGARVITEEPELDFFIHVPTVWDETKVISGEIGQYAVFARRSGAKWFVGGMNGNYQRDMNIPLDFLEKGKTYTATIYADDPTVKTRTKVRVETIQVTSETVVKRTVQKNNGIAIRLTQ